MKKEIKTKKAPLPVASYSQAVLVKDILFVSGQIGIDPLTGKLEIGFENQVRRIFENLKAIVEDSEFEIANIVKVTVYLTENVDFYVFNRLYSEFFKSVDIKPARSTLIVKALPLNALVEIDAIAIR